MERPKNLVCLLLAVTLILGTLTLNQTSAQEPNQVGLVVQFGDGQTETRCIEFSEEGISGYEVLLRSGLEVVVAGDVGLGSVVCSIEGEGCPADNCWCQCKTMGSDCTYWSYWNLDGEWVYSQMGLGGHFVRHGYVEGWRWGKTEPPPMVGFEEICAPPATDTPTPTATPTSTVTPTPMPTDTPAPTATWTPSPTPAPPTDKDWPTDTPLSTATATVTQRPVFTPTTEPSMLAAATPTASLETVQEEVPALGGEAPPADTPAVATDTPMPATETATAAPTLTVEIVVAVTPESSQTRTPAPTLPPRTETPTAEAVVLPTQTPVAVAVAAEPSGASEGTSSQPSGDGEPGRRTSNMLAILSIGAGVAYLFFGLFVVILAAIFVVVRRR